MLQKPTPLPVRTVRNVPTPSKVRSMRAYSDLFMLRQQLSSKVQIAISNSIRCCMCKDCPCWDIRLGYIGDSLLPNTSPMYIYQSLPSASLSSSNAIHPFHAPLPPAANIRFLSAFFVNTFLSAPYLSNNRATST